ncbi:WbqC family protein [candidate division WOR-3 bacterium]|nr:WbqC family protein [candidate division WOR-3 bacterium]
MIVAIHQPNYLPWLGYFAKMVSCDCFVIQDNVQMPGHSYVNRVQVRAPNGPQWLTVPVRRLSPDGTLIRSVEICTGDRRPWFQRHLARMREYYRAAPYWEGVMPWVTDLLSRDWTRLGEMNVCLIREVAARLGIDREVRLASVLAATGSKTELLVQIVKAVGGDAYLRGAGAVAYQDDRMLEREGITPLALTFDHPTYPQAGKQFVPGLSALDALFNCGFSAAADLIRAGVRVRTSEGCQGESDRPCEPGL